MIGVPQNRAYGFINQSSAQLYRDRITDRINEALKDTVAHTPRDIGTFFNPNPATEAQAIDVLFISWERGFWGDTIPGSFIRPYKHPDQALLSNNFTNDVFFVILDSPPASATSRIAVHDAFGNSSFPVRNSAFDGMDANNRSVVFYIADEEKGFHYVPAHSYLFSNINRQVQIGFADTLFDFEAPSGEYYNNVYYFGGRFNANVSPYPYRIIHGGRDTALGGGIAFTITNITETAATTEVIKQQIDNFYFFSNPDQSATITLKDCNISNLGVVFGQDISAVYTNVTLNVHNCRINALYDLSIEDFIQFLNQYDFWYNGRRYTNLMSSSVVSDASLAYTLVPSDTGIWRSFTNNGAVVITVDANSLSQIGDEAAIDYAGTGSLTLVAGAGGAVLNVNPFKTLVSDGQYSSIYIKKISSTNYRILGELAPV